MSKYHNDSSYASNPISLKLDIERLKKIHPETWWRKYVSPHPLEMIDEHMSLGDSRAAQVISLSPLRVSAYTDELDCCAVLEFSQHAAACILAFVPSLQINQRLITVNSYSEGPMLVSDLWNGPNSYHRYNNFFPVIADFYGDNSSAIAARLETIDEDEWNRLGVATKEYLDKNVGQVRDGSPFLSWRAP